METCNWVLWSWDFHCLDFPISGIITPMPHYVCACAAAEKFCQIKAQFWHSLKSCVSCWIYFDVYNKSSNFRDSCDLPGQGAINFSVRSKVVHIVGLSATCPPISSMDVCCWLHSSCNSCIFATVSPKQLVLVLRWVGTKEFCVPSSARQFLVKISSIAEVW